MTYAGLGGEGGVRIGIVNSNGIAGLFTGDERAVDIGFKLVGQLLKPFEFIWGQSGHIDRVEGARELRNAVREEGEGWSTRGIARSKILGVRKAVVRIEMVPGEIRQGHHQPSRKWGVRGREIKVGSR